MDAPIFLTLEDVMRIHARSLERFGGLKGIRDQGLLESAVAQPRATFGGEYLHAGLFEMAAAYAFHLAENQPFLDGNKRAAVGCALTFLGINGKLVDRPSVRIYEAMIAIANRQMTKAQLSDLFRELAGG